MPAAWCDGHHLWHWANGGPTDLHHGALLCGRHHDLVHTKGYHGQVVNGQVVWDLTPGAYDHWLERRRAAAGDAKALHDNVEHNDTSGGCGQDGSAGGDDGGTASTSDPAIMPAWPIPAVREYDLWGQPITGAGVPKPPDWRP